MTNLILNRDFDTSINLLLWLGYFLTEKNGLCSETKDSVVDDLKTCKEAVDEIKKKVKAANFKMEEEESDWPSGCYLYTINDGVYFNKQSTGSRHRSSQQICKSKGKQ